MKYAYENTILLFLKEKTQCQIVKKVAGGLKLNIYDANFVADIAAVPYFFAIIDATFLQQDFFSGFQKEMLKLENPKEFGIVLVGKHSFKIPSVLNKYITSIDIITEDWLRGMLLQKHKRAKSKKKAKGFQQKQIHRVVYILRELMNDNYLRLDELCDYFEVTEKTIRRDFEILNQLGESIVYDKRKKVYRNEYSLNGLTTKNE